MPRLVRCALIQASNVAAADRPLAEIRQAMMDKHEAYIAQAADSVPTILSSSKPTPFSLSAHSP